VSVVRVGLDNLVVYERNDDWRISEVLRRRVVAVELVFLVLGVDVGISELSVSLFRGGVDHRHLCVSGGLFISSG
jgi:hypothetical protein